MGISHEKVEARAYDLYLQRNGNCGSPLEDWLKAEKEVGKRTAERTEKKHLLKKTSKYNGKVPVHDVGK